MNIPKSLLLVLITSISIVGASAAAFLKLDGVDGESRDKDHKDWIELVSVNGLSKTDESSHSDRKAANQNLVLVKELDKASPMLAEACTVGESMGDVRVSHDGNTYTLKNATVVSFERKGNRETITLRYSGFTLNPIRVEATDSTNHNSTRSNRDQAVAAPESEGKGEAQDYNSSRSNRRG